MNQVSKWTPLHWIARYGDTEICKVMLESGGDPFIPDNNGYFPLDYAGYFQHEMMVKILVEHSIKRFKELVERFKAKKSVEVRLEKIKPSENLFVHSENFLNSPFYATRLLFWACHC
jgi:ankyrin repeat protein